MPSHGISGSAGATSTTPTSGSCKTVSACSSTLRLTQSLELGLLDRAVLVPLGVELASSS